MQEELSATSTAEDSEPMETTEREVSRVTQSMQSLCLASTIIDEGDSENPFMCTEYVKDIYKYLKELEASNSCTCTYMYVRMYVHVTCTCRKAVLHFLYWHVNYIFPYVTGSSCSQPLIYGLPAGNQQQNEGYPCGLDDPGTYAIQPSSRNPVPLCSHH